MTFTNQQWLYIGGAVLLVGWYLKNKAGNALDITSSENLASRAAEGLYGGGFDGQGSIGTDFYDLNTEYSPYALADKARANISDWWDGLWSGVDG
ncbi:hypothetical protein [Marinobacter salarius]|uniref:hypothetical protein n=1 Tax=Marinobacter salarius TaxID=1420917 RepID=UPI003D0C7619